MFKGIYLYKYIVTSLLVACVYLSLSVFCRQSSRRLNGSQPSRFALSAVVC